MSAKNAAGKAAGQAAALPVDIAQSVQELASDLDKLNGRPVHGFDLTASIEPGTPGALLLTWLDPDHALHTARITTTQVRRNLPAVLRVLLRGGWNSASTHQARAALRRHLLAICANQGSPA